MSYLPGKFVWFEHVSNAPAKAKAFYQGLFDWRIEDVSMGEGPPYSMIHNGETGIGGVRGDAGSARSHWMSYVSVPSPWQSGAPAEPAHRRGRNIHRKIRERASCGRAHWPAHPPASRPVAGPPPTFAEHR